LPLEPKFPTVAAAANHLKLRSTILDGEIVALDKDGIPRFQLLQQWQKRPTAPIVFFLFDLVWSDGHDLTGKTVLQRRDRLQQIITPVDGIQIGGYVENRGFELYRLAKEKGLEGIIGKRKTSALPTRKAITRLAENQVTTATRIRRVRLHRRKRQSKAFWSTAIGRIPKRKIAYFGHSGTGFSEKGMKEAIERLMALFIDKQRSKILPRFLRKSNGLSQSWCAK
jgi:bifunctional non-homologous end joining protein LigD